MVYKFMLLYNTVNKREEYGKIYLKILRKEVRVLFLWTKGMK